MQTVRIRCVQRIYTCHTLRKKALKCKITHSLCQNRFQLQLRCCLISHGCKLSLQNVFCQIGRNQPSIPQYVLHVDEMFRFCLKYLAGKFHLYCVMLFQITYGLSGHKEFLVIISSKGTIIGKRTDMKRAFLSYSLQLYLKPFSNQEEFSEILYKFYSCKAPFFLF